MSYNPTSVQVEDDLETLELMVRENKCADSLFRPTNYWAARMDDLADEIRKNGLHDFRRSSDKFSTFNSQDLSTPLCWVDLKSVRGINNRLFRQLPGWTKLVDWISQKLSQALIFRNGWGPDSLHQMSYSHVERVGNLSPNALPLTSVEESTVGNPEECFQMKGRNYSYLFLEMYLKYAFVSQNLNIENFKVIAELGSGMGRQIELLKKLYPKISFLVFDIPPTIYVAERYLNTVLPNQVKTYLETRDMNDLSDLEPGMIYIFGAQDFPRIKTAQIDLFWNAASFGEMEPDVVENYLTYVRDAAENVFLYQAMGGKELASKPGRPGVLKKTTRSHYLNSLPNFQIVSEEPEQTVFAGETTYSNLLMSKNRSN